jgi:hypothetical protein
MHPYFFTSKETKAILGISDCNLMHMRTAGRLKFIKKNNSFLYELPCGASALAHPLGTDLIHWYKNKHKVDINNEPSSVETKQALEMLLGELLLPLQRKFGHLQITYGFTSSALKRYITAKSPAGTAPDIDQHSSCELNTAGNQICSRKGAACDISVEGASMAEVVRYIVTNLNYDRIYYYGTNRPLHISCSSEPTKHLQIMKESEKGRRYPAQKAFREDAITLAETL